MTSTFCYPAILLSCQKRALQPHEAASLGMDLRYGVPFVLFYITQPGHHMYMGSLLGTSPPSRSTGFHRSLF